MGNLVAACYGCNSDKGPLSFEEFMRVRHDPTALDDARKREHLRLNTAARDGPWYGAVDFESRAYTPD